MASIYTEIRNVFEVELEGVTGVPEIAWENVPYDPDRDTPFIEMVLVPTRREPAVRGLNPQMYYQGYCLFNVCYPKNRGPQSADDMADTIIEAFEATTDLTYNGTIVSLRYAERDQGYTENGHYCVPVRVGWYIYN